MIEDIVAAHERWEKWVKWGRAAPWLVVAALLFSVLYQKGLILYVLPTGVAADVYVFYVALESVKYSRVMYGLAAVLYWPVLVAALYANWCRWRVWWLQWKWGGAG